MEPREMSDCAIHASPDEPMLDRAADWLSVRCHESLGAEILLRGRATRPVANVTIAKRDGTFVGVSVLSRTGSWYLEATDAAATQCLVNALASPPTRLRLTTAASVRDWAVPAVTARWRLARHHRLLAMTCARASGGEGRWAVPADVETLRLYQSAYNAERQTAVRPNFADAVARQQVAVLDRDGAVAAVVKRSGETARYACIGGTFTFPQFRQQGLGRSVTAFLVERLLEQRPRVHLIVDDDNTPALALYRALDFGEIGECFVDYLE